MKPFTHLCLSVLASVLVCSNSTADLVSYWSFDGDLNDSENGNNGTYVGGAPAYGTGAPSAPGAGDMLGDSITFNGAAETYVNVNQNAGLPITSTNEFTIAMWVKGDGVNANDDDRIFSEGSTTDNNPLFNLGTRSGGGGPELDFFYRVPDGANTGHLLSNGAVFDDTWHHVAWSDASGVATLYVDGIQDSTFNYSNLKTDLASDTTTFGGILRGATCCNYTGAIDEAYIWNTALSAGELKDVFGFFEIPDPPPPAQNLWVDFGSSTNTGGGPGGAQENFVAFEGTESAGTDPITESFSTVLGMDDTVDVTISGYTHFRDYEAVTGGYAGASPLLSDMVLRNADGTMSLVLDNLAAGVFEMTTYHHSTQFGGGVFDILVLDAVSSGPGGGTVSAGPAPADGTVFTLTTIVTSDGTGPITVDLSGGAAQQHLALNGIQLSLLDLRPKDHVLSIDVNDRGMSESVDASVTQPGFSEFVIGGDENNDISTPTTRTFGDISVTIGPGVSDESNNIGDRWRAEPADAGFFTEGSLLRDFAFFRGDTSEHGVDLLVEGLEPNQLHEVTIWSVDDGSPGNRTSDWFAGGELVQDDYTFDGNAIPPSPTFDGAYSFTFEANSDADGSLLITGRQAGGDIGVFLNGFTISAVVPEPSSSLFLLIGFAGILMPRCRRRK